MNKLITAAALTAAFVATPALATDTILGYSEYYLAQDIAALGYNVAGVEEWGNRVVATVVDAQGHRSFKVFDPSNLAQVR